MRVVKMTKSSFEVHEDVVEFFLMCRQKNGVFQVIVREMLFEYR